MTRLPFVDEHAVVVDASPERAWSALGEVVPRAFSSTPSGLLARALGCTETAARGEPLEHGSAMPGFRVARSEPGSELTLAGEHRFSRYALTFRLDQPQPHRTRVRAETRAAFPGLLGGAYRTAVIGSRGHVLLLRRLLWAIRRRAERA